MIIKLQLKIDYEKSHYIVSSSILIKNEFTKRL